MINYESIFNFYTFQIGACISSIMVLNILISLIIAKFHHLRILEITVFYSIKRSILSSRIQHTVLQLGWIPIFASLKFDVNDIENDAIKTYNNNVPYKLNSKSILERFVILSLPSLILMLIGYFLISLNSDPIPFLNSFLDLVLFQQSTSVFIEQNHHLIADLPFIISFICFFIGFLNSVSNFTTIIRDAYHSILISLLQMGISLIFIIAVSKILIFHFSVPNLISFVLGTYLIGIVSYVVIKLLQKTLPHY